MVAGRGPSAKRGGAAAEPPQFSAHFSYGQTAECIKMPLGIDVGLSPGDFVLDGNPVSSPKRGRSPPPQFSAHFYCGQTAECIKIPLGMEVGLSPGDFVSDGDPVPSPKVGGAPPHFRPTCIVAKRLHGSICNLIRTYFLPWPTRHYVR